jgi:hypothetical protein
MTLPRRSLPLPVLKSLKCTKCGAPIELRGGPRSAVVVCAYCGSAMDARDPNYAILWQHQQATKFEPLIPLGTRGTLRGEKLECIGYMRRAQHVDGMDYTWSEYLLFNPFKGYRWLTDYNGHWTLMRECMALPVSLQGPVASDPPTTWVNYEGRNFKHFASYMARVTYVLGEFYWAVEMGQQSMLADYVAPPYTVSAELNQDNEVVWSVGEYLSGREVFAAFGLTSSPPATIGVGPNQPSPIADVGKIWTNYALFVSLAFLITLIFSMFSQNKVVLAQAFTYGENQKERSVVSNYFDLEGRTSNVVVELRCDGLSNRWASVAATLVNDTTNDAIDFWLDTQYYGGVDDGEAWHEGDGTAEVIVPEVPSGHYYLRLDPESGRNENPDRYDPNKPEPGARVFEYRITVTRDHTRWSFFWWTVFLLLPLPIIESIRSSSFENRRWMDSDHPRVQSS